jgi:hypothetical protein
MSSDMIMMLTCNKRLLDLGHTFFVDVSLWDYLILHFGNHERIDVISW